jgi:hypothetical protein
MLPPLRATRRKEASAGPEASAWAAWKEAKASSWERFSSWEARASSLMAGGASGAAALRKVLTPMIGSSPLCFLSS